jgi:hypothetical protein
MRSLVVEVERITVWCHSSVTLNRPRKGNVHPRTASIRAGSNTVDRGSACQISKTSGSINWVFRPAHFGAARQTGDEVDARVREERGDGGPRRRDDAVQTGATIDGFDGGH